MKTKPKSPARTYLHLQYEGREKFSRALRREQRRGSVVYWYQLGNGTYVLCVRKVSS